MLRSIDIRQIDEAGEMPVPPSLDHAISDGVLAVIAGSDTTASVVSNVFYYLMQKPPDFVRLRQEVDEVFPPGEGDPLDSAKLAGMRYLNAVL